MSYRDIEQREKFLFTLEWLLAVTRRYSVHVQFGLVHVNYADARVLGDIYGAQEAAQRLDEIAHSLCNAFRKTDLVARDGTDFWILAPYTSTDRKLVEKVRYIIEIASQNGLYIVERDISIFSLPFGEPRSEDDCSAAEFLAYLKRNHIALASHEMTLPPAATEDARPTAAS